MTKEKIEIVKHAIAILDKEGFKDYYGGEVASIFWEAVRWIEKAMERRIEI